MLSWFKFCSNYAKFIRRGLIIPVVTRYPDWRAEYTGGSDQDKTRWLSPNQIIEYNTNPFSFQSDELDVISSSVFDKATRKIPQRDVEAIFWAFHYLGTGGFIAKDLEAAAKISKFFQFMTTKAQRTAINLSVASSSLFTRLAIRGANVSSEEIWSIIETDEFVSGLRARLVSFSRHAQASLQNGNTFDVIALQDEYDDWIGSQATTKSNLLPSIFMESKSASMTFLGASIGTYFGSTDLLAIVGAGLGAILPNILNVNKIFDDTSTKNRVRVAAGIMISKLV